MMGSIRLVAFAYSASQIYTFYFSPHEYAISTDYKYLKVTFFKVNSYLYNEKSLNKFIANAKTNIFFTLCCLINITEKLMLKSFSLLLQYFDAILVDFEHSTRGSFRTENNVLKR